MQFYSINVWFYVMSLMSVEKNFYVVIGEHILKAHECAGTM
jgi:hypothetical protein